MPLVQRAWLLPTLLRSRSRAFCRSAIASGAPGCLSVAVAGVSPENLWVAMMRKVKQPERFLPDGVNVTVETYEDVPAHLRSALDPIWRCLTFETR